MFQRFSERARQIVVHGAEEARELGHPLLAVEHLLLGAARVGAAGLDAEAVRAAVVDSRGRQTARPPGQLPFAATATEALERANERAGKGPVLPAHVLLALLEDDDVSALVARCGADPAELRTRAADQAADELASSPDRFEVTIGDQLIGDLGNPRVDVRMIGAILRRDGLAAGWLRTAGVDEAWVREFGG